MPDHIAPYFGYLASLLLIAALIVNNDLKFRWLNTCGNLAFITYALVIGAIPVLITNCLLLCINLYYLYKIYSKNENFELLQFRGDEKLAESFLHYYKEDIADYFPAFEPEQLKGNLNFVVTRDLVIANIFSASMHENGDATVRINYTTQKYRDYKIGTFIFGKEKDFLISKGIKRIVYDSVINKKHRRFLKVMGFMEETNRHSTQMIKSL